MLAVIRKYSAIFILSLITGNICEGVTQTSTPKNLAIATFAGGCFWCMEGPFDELPGVISTTSGYTGGQTLNPTYKDVSLGKTGHYESVQVLYDPAKVNYQQLLDVFWHNIDPFDNAGQFCDKGSQYKAVIFYHDDNQKHLAEATKLAIQQKFQGQTIMTEILPASQFYAAEQYHQNYYQINPVRYKFYRYTCGRDQRLQQVWAN